MLDNITAKLGAKKPSEQLPCNVRASYQIDLDSFTSQVMNKLTRQTKKRNVRREADNVTPQSHKQTHIVIILLVLKGISEKVVASCQPFKVKTASSDLKIP